MCLANRMKICDEISEKTAGNCDVMKNSMQFDEKFMSFANPCERKEDLLLNTQFIVSFPKMSFSEMPVLCACHKNFIKLGYECSRCKAWNCNMPSTCAVCKTPLLTALQIVRSKNRADDYVRTEMVEVQAMANGNSGANPFMGQNMKIQNGQAQKSGAKVKPIGAEIKKIALTEPVKCSGCFETINANNKKPVLMTICEKCDSRYCTDCDFFVNESLKFCPNCNRT
jgi:hypothetical protein